MKKLNKDHNEKRMAEWRMVKLTRQDVHNILLAFDVAQNEGQIEEDNETQLKIEELFEDE